MNVVSLSLVALHGFLFRELVWSLLSSHDLLTSMMFFGKVLHESTSHGMQKHSVCVCKHLSFIHSFCLLFEKLVRL